jgi:hypothetical protein
MKSIKPQMVTCGSLLLEEPLKSQQKNLNHNPSKMQNMFNNGWRVQGKYIKKCISLIQLDVVVFSQLIRYCLLICSEQTRYFQCGKHLVSKLHLKLWTCITYPFFDTSGGPIHAATFHSMKNIPTLLPWDTFSVGILQMYQEMSW